MSKIPENESVFDRIRREEAEKAEAQKPKGKSLDDRLNLESTNPQEWHNLRR